MKMKQDNIHEGDGHDAQSEKAIGSSPSRQCTFSLPYAQGENLSKIIKQSYSLDQHMIITQCNPSAKLGRSYKTDQLK